MRRLNSLTTQKNIPNKMLKLPGGPGFIPAFFVMPVFTLLLGTWMLFRGISRRQAWWVIGAFAMIGVGFNMKMLQAYMVVPAFYLLYLLAFQGEWKKKLAVLAAASVVVIVVPYPGRWRLTRFLRKTVRTSGAVTQTPCWSSPLAITVSPV